jgi:hypothetical protein
MASPSFPRLCCLAIVSGTLPEDRIVKRKTYEKPKLERRGALVLSTADSSISDNP